MKERLPFCTNDAYLSRTEMIAVLKALSKGGLRLPCFFLRTFLKVFFLGGGGRWGAYRRWGPGDHISFKELIGDGGGGGGVSYFRSVKICSLSAVW